MEQALKPTQKNAFQDKMMNSIWLAHESKKLISCMRVKQKGRDLRMLI
jgi:hypothetical protein